MNEGPDVDGGYLLVQGCSVRRDILEAFVDAQAIGVNREREPWSEAGGVEAARREYRERHKAAGLCVYCPKPADPATVHNAFPVCTEHRQRAIARTMAKYIPHPRPERTPEVVAAARAKQNERDRVRRKERAVEHALAGLCTFCSREALPDRALCSICAAKRRARYDHERRARGLGVNRCSVCLSREHNRQRCPKSKPKRGS